MTQTAMIALIENWIGYLWLGFLILWVLAAFTTKRAVQVQTGSSRLVQALTVFAGLTLIFNFGHFFTRGWLVVRLFPETLTIVSAGAALTVAGLLFSVWARAVLGTNWSGTVTIKQDHELIMRGPYRIVRHPIYTGVLLALLGSAFIGGCTRCFIGLVVVGFGFWLKLQLEEQFMLQRFGAQYIDYRQHVHALIPFVL